MGSPWSIALDAQLAIIRYFRSPPGQQYAAYLASDKPDRDRIRTALNGPRTPAKIAIADELLAKEREFGKRMADDLADLVDAAATYWVSEEMSRFLFHAHSDIPDRGLTVGDQPQLTGFVWLDEPPTFETADDEHLTIRSLLWSWHEPSSACDIIAFKEMDRSPGFLLKTLTTWRAGEPPDSSLKRLLQAFWILSQQRIAQIDQRPVERHVRRRAERGGLDVPEDGISVVTLRRPEGVRPADTALVSWSHRWMVSGHWRNQWYPATQEHRPRWIDPYEKGPESKPLVLKDRVYRWVR